MFEYLNRNDLWRFNSSNGRTKAGSVAKPQLNVVSIRRLQNKQTNKQTNRGEFERGKRKMTMATSEGLKLWKKEKEKMPERSN